MIGGVWVHPRPYSIPVVAGEYEENRPQYSRDVLLYPELGLQVRFGPDSEIYPECELHSRVNPNNRGRQFRVQVEQVDTVLAFSLHLVKRSTYLDFKVLNLTRFYCGFVLVNNIWVITNLWVGGCSQHYSK